MAAVARPLARDPAAADLLNTMIEQRDTMRTILEETLEAERESGRTVCGRGGRLRGPLARFPSAVELNASCPLRTGGAWHSHTHQLRSPEQSLPDTANVVFGNLDVSIVVGVDDSDTLVRAYDRSAMVTAFQDALGLEVTSTSAVVDAIKTGQIPDPPAARTRVRSRFGPLFSRRTTSFPDIASRVPARLAEPDPECPDIQFHGHARGAVPQETRLQRRCREEFHDGARRRRDHVQAVAETVPARAVRSAVMPAFLRRIVFGA